MSSANISRSIYEQLRADGLAARTKDVWDQATVRLVAEMLDAEQRILDAGCGYGRIAVPLATAGHRVVGIDVSPHMLEQSRDRADAANVDIELHLGELAKLPFADATFDVVLCMWLTFNELLQRSEQLAALREMCRVLKPGGWVLLDGPPFSESSEAVAAADRGPSELLEDGASQGTVPREHPVATAFDRLLSEVGVERYLLFVDDCPGRPRYFLRFWK